MRMKAVQVRARGEPMTPAEIPVLPPGKGQVLLKVQVCGICHCDARVIEGAALSCPRIPGHEFAGTAGKNGPGAARL